ncbi:MAG TPA: VWA domain-containing protein [Acidobacteriaceae bacterium]
MKRRLWIAAAVGLLCSPGLTFACAQKPAENPPAAASSAPEATPVRTISVEAKLVLVPVVVRDHKDALVNDLTQNDFSLQVEGKPQAIRYFDHDTNVPLTLGLLVDVSPSQRKALADEQAASQSFLDTMLAPAVGNRAADKAFVVQFAKDIELLQDVTDAKPRLQAALKELGTESASFHTTDDSGPETDREGRRIQHGGTALYDAIYLSGDEVMSKQTLHRRALVVLTDGIDRGSKEALTDAIEAAQRSDTTVYGIYYKGESPRQEDYNRPMDRRGGGYPGGGYPGGGYPGGGYPGGGYPGGYPGGNNPQGGGTPRGGGGDHKPNVDGKHVLERICGETGGRVFELSRKQSLDDIYKQIGEELRSQYRLGFMPTGDAAKDKYHQIDLTLTGEPGKKKLDVQTRDGYYMGEP